MIRQLPRAALRVGLRLCAAPVARSNATAGSGSPTSISLPEALAIMDTVKVFMEHGVPGKKLEEIQASDSGVQQRWQEMVQIRLQCELHVINAFGYEPDQMGMMAFRQTMAQLMTQTPASDLARIQDADKAIWSVMLVRAFDETPEPITVEQARQVVFHFSSQVQQNEFLSKVEASVRQGGDMSEVELNSLVMASLLEVWKEVLPTYGYGDGDKGYVRFQAALVQHSTDPQISTMIQSALMTVTSRAGLTK